MSNDACTNLAASDPKAAVLYDILPGDIKAKLSPAQNCQARARSIYANSISLLEKEEDEFVTSGGHSGRPFTDLVSTKTTFRVPWLVNDFNPLTNTDNQMLVKIGGAIAKARAETKAKGLVEGTLEFNRAFVAELVSWMESAKGVSFVVVEVEGASREMMLMEFLVQPDGRREGDCSELSRLAYTVFRLAGLAPEFLYVEKDRIDPEITEHMAIGLHLDPDHPEKIFIVDLYHHIVSDQGHTEQSKLTALGAMAVYYDNLATMLWKSPQGNNETDRIRKLYQEAMRYDPGFAHTHFNYSLLLWQRYGNKAEACNEARRAADLRPAGSGYAKRMQKYCK
ncbi:MAG: hypothetical protein V2A66_02585 [Pseudomonadota bacterium]